MLGCLGTWKVRLGQPSFGAQRPRYRPSNTENKTLGTRPDSPTEELGHVKPRVLTRLMRVIRVCRSKFVLRSANGLDSNCKAG